MLRQKEMDKQAEFERKKKEEEHRRHGKDRRSYMSAYLLSKLGKRDKMWGLPSILSLFHNEFNKFNNSGVRML